jgi:glycyl-tRNA synthetase beta chain
VVQLAATQPERAVEKLGPFVAQAFAADGKPTPAAAGFAKSNGVDVEQLARVPSDKGERLVFRAMEPGRRAMELLPAMIEKALQELPIPKRMRWGSRRAEFVRPVHWLVMLYGSEIIDCDILEQKAGRTTRGHRFHSEGELVIASPADYQKLLRDHKVEVCFKLRREKIVAQVEKCAAELGGKAVIARDLLDEVTGLVEWPVALAGKFEARFLDVPQEALISSMSEHQKYFHVVDANDKLMPHFITVANIESTDPAQVIDGNERVIRPRLTDAAFFYQTDLKTPRKTENHVVPGATRHAARQERARGETRCTHCWKNWRQHHVGRTRRPARQMRPDLQHGAGIRQHAGHCRQLLRDERRRSCRRGAGHSRTIFAEICR